MIKNRSNFHFLNSKKNYYSSFEWARHEKQGYKFNIYRRRCDHPSWKTVENKGTFSDV